MTSTTQQYAHTEEAKYIISLNEKLLTENTELRSTVNEKDAEINTIETELGQRETQVTYMRGLLKNFVAIDEIRQELKSGTAIILSEQLTLASRVETQCLRHSRISNYYLLVSMCLYLVCLCGLSTWVLTLLFAIDYSLYMWRKRSFNDLLKYKDRIENRKETRVNKNATKALELKEILKGCDFLNEYIDQI